MEKNYRQIAHANESVSPVNIAVSTQQVSQIASDRLEVSVPQKNYKQDALSEQQIFVNSNDSNLTTSKGLTQNQQDQINAAKTSANPSLTEKHYHEQRGKKSHKNESRHRDRSMSSHRRYDSKHDDRRRSRERDRKHRRRSSSSEDATRHKSRHHRHSSRKDRDHRDQKDRRYRRSPSSESRDRKHHHRKQDKTNNQKIYSRSNSSDSRDKKRYRRDSREKIQRGKDDPRRKDKKIVEDVHPYFKKKTVADVIPNVDEHGNELFWDGFQWVSKAQRQLAGAFFDPLQSEIDKKVQEVSGFAKEDNLKRVAQTRTVIVDGIPLDLGLTSKELQSWFYQQLTNKIGENHQVQIVDIDIEEGGTSSVFIELAKLEMVEKFKSLNGENCLGEKISVRKVGEETTRTNAQAAVIALKALNMITGQKPLVKTSDENAEEEIQLGPQTLEVKANSLKTINTSRIIKISNIYDRDRVMTVDDYEELKDNFEAEMQNIGQLRGLKVIRNGEERLGAEVGSIFVEFKDIKGAQLGLKQVKGRIYDGFEVKCVYIDEKMYREHLVSV